jgi:cytoskeletal protein RodZ
LERKMSSTPTGTAGEGSSFSSNNENQNIQWPPLSIIGIVVTVLGFIAVTWFIFWIFRREKSQRRRATAGTCPLAATNLCKPSRLEAESTDILRHSSTTALANASQIQLGGPVIGSRMLEGGFQGKRNI